VFACFWDKLFCSVLGDALFGLLWGFLLPIWLGWAFETTWDTADGGGPLECVLENSLAIGEAWGPGVVGWGTGCLTYCGGTMGMGMKFLGKMVAWKCFCLLLMGEQNCSMVGLKIFFFGCVFDLLVVLRGE